jgi:hypothetical protein
MAKYRKLLDIFRKKKIGMKIFPKNYINICRTRYEGEKAI